MFEAKLARQNIIKVAVPVVGLFLAFACTNYRFCKSLSPQAFKKVATFGGKGDLLSDESGNNIPDEELKPRIELHTFDPILIQAYQNALRLGHLVWPKKIGQGHPVVKE